MRLSLPPISASPSPDDVNYAVSMMRAELEATSDPTCKALLHYELALLFEQTRDDNAAAKELLLAVNTQSTLHEPLEHLVGLIERRRSHANLGKLLDRLGRVAETPAQVTRAQLARGDFLTDHRTNLAQAAEAYEQVIQLQPEHRLAWLSLHYLGARQSDARLVESALNSRIQHASHKEYRDGLRLQLARFQALRGRHDLARATLEAAASPHSPMLYPALLQLENLVKSEDFATRAKVLEQQAELLALGLADGSYAAAHGVPVSHLRRTTVADVSLRTALNLAFSGGSRGRITQALNRALDAGTDPLLVARLSRERLADASEEDPHAAAATDLPEAEEISGAAYVAKALGSSSATSDEAVELLGKALSCDAHGLTARALQLDALWARQAFADLARAYEQVAQLVNDDAARTRHLQLSAICWTFSAEPSERARAALNLIDSGPEATASVARLRAVLAAARRDELWRREALEQLVATDAGAAQVSALLELAVRALQRRDYAEARLRVQALSRIERSMPLALLMTAFVPALTSGISHGDQERAAAIEALARYATPQTRVALTQWAANTRTRGGDLEAARDLLLQVHSSVPDNVELTLQLVPTLLDLDDAELAVRVLEETAERTVDKVAKVTLFSYSGILAWNANARETAVRCFEAAASTNAGAASAQLLQWALRAASPDDAAARRKLLSTGDTHASEEGRLHALERFALEVGFGNQKAAATDALNSADELSLDEIGEALQLARALWPDSMHHEEALRHLQGQGPLAKELAACSSFYAAKNEAAPTANELTNHVKRWAALGSLPACLEWLGVALATGQAAEEALALRAIAPHLGEEEEKHVRAAATLVEHSAGLSPRVSLEEAGAATASVQQRLVAAEVHAPTSLPAERARVLEGLAPHWTDEHPEHALTAQLLAAYNYLADEDFTNAARLFRDVVQRDPADISGWEGVAECSRHNGARDELAEALMHLGKQHSDKVLAAAALREAAECFLDDLDNPSLGWLCLEEALDLDISPSRAFERLFRQVRKQGRFDRVIELCTQRLTVAESAKEITKLHWERARAFRNLGQLNESLSDLGNVRMLEPDHVGARALASEIYISIESFGRAAVELSELAGLPNAPAEQRQLSAMTAIDLFDNRLDDLTGALATFELVRDVPGNVQPLLEHLVAACARRRRWDEAVTLLEDLQLHGKSSHDRAEAARLELAILRDELDKPDRALGSVRTLLKELPGDPEAVDLVLDGVFGEQDTVELLNEHLPGILRAAAGELDGESAARLARIAEELDHLDLRLLSLASLVLTGSTEAEVFAELDQLLERCAPYPQMSVPQELLASLTCEGDGGPLLEITKLIGPHLPDLLGPSLKSLGLGRKERKAALDAIGVRSEVSAWTGALSIGEVEVYLANRGGYEVLGIADEKQPSLVIASEAHALDVRDRGAIAAWLFGLARGTSVSLQRPATDVAALLVAACRVGGVVPESPPFALTPEFERLLGRELPRRTRRALEPLAREVIAHRQDPLMFAKAARDTLNRVAAVACGDFSQVILTEAERVAPTRNLDGSRREQLAALVRFCLSPDYLRIREQLGLSAR
jgi:cellulose synthase operon protein C